MTSTNKLSRVFIAIIITIAYIAKPTLQYGSGAPPRACTTMLPFHGTIAPQTSSAPYEVKSSASQVRQGSNVKVTISSPLRVPIGGFFLQARSVQDRTQILGNWTNLPEVAKTTNCNSNADSATHTSPANKDSVVLQWNAPKDFLGAVVFKATVAQEYSTFWGGVESTLVEVVTPDTVIATTTPSETSPEPTATTKYTIETTTSAAIKPIHPFYEGCGSTKLCFGSTSSCLNTLDCVAAVAVTVKGEAYTFELIGTQNPAYVATGLSDDLNMGSDSSMECQQVNGLVTAHTSWTYPKSDPYVSRENVDQSMIQLLRSSFTDGILYCQFTRDTRSTVRDVTFDLVNDRYHIMIVSGDDLKANSVGFHSKVFERSEKKIALSDVGNVAGASKLLLRLHGAFMLIAWIGTSSCGILLARYFRQTWVGKQLGGKDMWFAWHRVFMVSTWLLTMAAFIIILIEVGGWTGTGDNPHAIIGIVTIVLCFLQPIGAFFRPHPNTTKRPIFNWVHWFFGNAAHILGIVTVFFAVYLNKAELPGWMVYILAAFVAFHVIMHLILSIAVCVSDGRINNGRVNAFPMKDLMTNTRQALNHDRKTDAPHSGFRKSLLGIYFVINILFVITLVCLIALAPIEQTYQSVSNAISGAMSQDKN
ncbi:putative ferric-chelate reductase 1 homolog [Arctopsyche grandis]|uniref:putative ferric-chelate reductase 1 homolog n=1 Tax=Arctopsyche grandis TaxID=121162 RepID=UPI00406D7FA6